ncbi:MAG: hypothetical protein A3A43_03025 [Candidatus Liptonbacteria bacterium RIFCSPLOWO2_01_FULL_56_20]|uniref:HTH HARE-type domain-containing protein n=1 Tax=Candidatus Liptonbacteria bacterium RIFCSPLOWO2_01_FULL_56_20 TaxID=1798652 RepID=A0A1G2CHZ7_9BACT|nr:MAG: hypothetical protein A2681_00155 [Candidatus Liptonbacteria bacterium RIFCSPHIGHO2_01_FULL_56_18b]OGZ01016.1 MAG: hypothetical protein A3A43_03025 [Candidatus Liptonbacteria bacterium RIFCSPLOWO2_01_FULL_56_20]
MIAVTKIFNAFWDGLGDREKEIIVARFGLDKSGRMQTLAALGDRYGITRERVRQIEAAALSALRGKISESAACTEILEKSKRFLKESGGAAKKENLFQHHRTFAEGLGENQLAVLLEASGAFSLYPEDKDFWPFYYTDKASLRNATAFLGQWASFLGSKRDHVLSGRYGEYLESFLKRKGTSRAHAANYLSISKKIHKNPYGDIGLTDWAEIRPRTIRDRIYLVLKKQRDPLHFRAIARTINDVGFGGRKASPPTVHNELIKDERFVLVGRGIYALREHGYEPGTAKEVIKRVLTREGPLKPRDVILAVQKERFFKPNTVLVNLQNKAYFQRLQNGTYHVRET